jgi:hypothetical protein
MEQPTPTRLLSPGRFSVLDKKDSQWWVREVQKHPESAVDLVRLLADRLAFLDKQTRLRGELIALRRRGKAEFVDAELGRRQRVHELEEALRQNGAEGRLLVYARDRIEANLPLSASREAGLGRELPADVALLRCNPAARLFIVTEESRLFALSLADLPEPAPGESAAPLGNPANVAAILDAAVFEQCRFLVLLTRSGHVYSLLAGTINQIARRGDKLIRNLIPEDPVVAAVPTHNGDPSPSRPMGAGLASRRKRLRARGAWSWSYRRATRWPESCRYQAIRH